MEKQQLIIFLQGNYRVWGPKSFRYVYKYIYSSKKNVAITNHSLIFIRFLQWIQSAGGNETPCTTEDYSVNNLPGNSIFKQLELYVGNTNVIDQSVSAYPYKCITETLLSTSIITY